MKNRYREELLRKCTAQLIKSMGFLVMLTFGVSGIIYAQNDAQMVNKKIRSWSGGPITKMKKVPRRSVTHEGKGPYNKLIIKGVIMIDGTGAPATGPVNIIIKGNKIADIRRSRRGTSATPKEGKGVRVINAHGMYITPGFIDVHDHIGRRKVNFNPSYDYKLQLAHGVTTMVGVSFFNNMKYDLKQAKLSAENKIVAPRLFVYESPRNVSTPKEARKWVHHVKKLGVRGIGEGGPSKPKVLAALYSTADSLGMTTMRHNGQDTFNRVNAIEQIKLGLDEVTHMYGVFVSLEKNHSEQKYPIGYINSNNAARYRQTQRIYQQIYGPGTKQWKHLIHVFTSHNTLYSPTLSIYSAWRNVPAARNSVWFQDYLLPQTWNFYGPTGTGANSAAFYDYTSRNEAAWQHFYRVWEQFVDDLNKAGGRIIIGEDTNYLYRLAGFEYITSMKMLNESGLTPLEVIRSATMYGAQSLFLPKKPNGKPIEFGVIKSGKKADLLLFTRNPLNDFNMIFGTGAVRLSKKTGEVVRVRDLKYTIKDGIIYDVSKLLKDVRQMVKKAKSKNPPMWTPLPDFGLKPAVLAPADNKNLYYHY